MAWRLQGTYIENCNCTFPCRCSPSDFTVPADHDRCHVAFAFHIDSGQVEGVDVSNLGVVILADSPQMMLEGKWRVGVLIDSAASREQAEKLGAVFFGKLGGPWGKLAPLFGELLGWETAPIDFSNNGRNHRVRVGDSVDIEVEDYVSSRNKNGDVTKLTGLGHTVNSTITQAKAKTARAKAFGLEFLNDGMNGYSAPFSWTA